VKLKTGLGRGVDELKACKLTKFNDCNGTLPEKVMTWSGICTDDGSLPDNTTLACRNDHGDSFKAIADIIEGGYETL
jgi:hypothetical protein